MGPWTTDYRGNEILKAPKDKYQRFTHMCDYLSSRKFLDIKFENNNIASNLAFIGSIKDDILDYDGTESVGKPLAVDILEQKITMPLLGALQNVPAAEQERVRSMVKDIVGKPELRDEIVAFVKANGGLEYSVTRLEEYVEAAVRALDVLPESKEKEFLVKLAHYTGKRDK